MRVVLVFAFAFGVASSVGGKVLESEAESEKELTEGGELEAKGTRHRRVERRWLAGGPSSTELAWLPSSLRITRPASTPPRPRWRRPRPRPGAEIEPVIAIG